MDDLRALAFETMWSSDGGLWFSARYWAALWGEPSGPQTLVGVLVLGGTDALALSVSILHQL